MRFIKNVLAVIVGLFAFSMIGFISLMILAAVFGSTENTAVANNSVLVLDLENISLDYHGKETDPLVQMLKGGNKAGFTEVINAIENAKTDERIKGISIVAGTHQVGMAQLKTLRDKISEFKNETDKFVYGYAPYYDQASYYLASAADSVFVNPAGQIDLMGLSSTVTYFKGLQEKTGFKMEVIRHGKYKSAVEPFLDDHMSEANREQITAMLQSIWKTYSEDIAKSRNISIAKLDSIANNLSANFPTDAQKLGIVDRALYEDEFHNLIRKKLAINDEKEEYNTIGLNEYALDTALKFNATGKDKIAVIYAQGQITSGEGDPTYIGDGAIRRAIRDARNDEKVKAIVLRVDSPGGSALTSDLIWRELELTKKVKPVITSMGNYAASGGYYIACNSNYIFAEPTTITGSIGVFGMVPNASELSKNIGVNAEVVKTHQYADGFNLLKGLDPGFREHIQRSIEHTYNEFTQKVADGRKKSRAAIDSIGQGRVWTGSEALQIGLVDELGSLEDAINYAAKMAKTDQYRVVDFPQYENNLQDVLNNYPVLRIRQAILGVPLVKEISPLLENAMKAESSNDRIYMLLPFEIKW